MIEVVGFVSNRMAAGGQILTRAGRGVAGPEQGGDADQGEESQGDREFAAHDTDAF